ncbi:hypothetical protein [Stutzerimonas stutzeri]|uniref:hypothetical protein n=1 Tax=Stutzerimonas stutzeri TaxID=316 RepID=UPI0015E2EDC7|nr:hypothetical protein [Stutzerimonas stutzeri]MBA1280446.1 hypothetical protein [Stutzerimonas stutzeri]
MNREASIIEDRLHSAGYRTERFGGEVSVFDPVYQSVAGSSQLVLTNWNLKEIRSIRAAWAFIQERE